MQIAICDDEKEIRDALAEKIKRIYPEAALSFYQSGEALLLSYCQPDILLLDIQMPGKDGMETAREFRRSHENTILIFVTAFEDYVFQAFDVGAFHYLVKPFDDIKFEEVLRNAARQLEDRKNKGFERIKKAARLVITTGGKHIIVNLEDIVYAEVFDRKVILHTVNEDIEYYGKMKELEEKAGDDFYRSHRAYLVNFNYIRKYDATTIYLEKGQAIMAKQNYREFVKRYLHFNQRKGGKIMAMEINGNLPDYSVRKQNYSSYAAQSMAGSSAAGSTKKKETENTSEMAGSNKSTSTSDYANELAKLVPSVDFKIGNSCSSAKSGKSLTVNPKLLEKMQNDPEQAKETKELIRGVESAMNLIDSINKASGWTVVYKHSYIDENGKYHSVGYYRNDFMLNMSDKLREERKKNSEKLLEKAKEKAAEKEEKSEETLEEKKEEKAETVTAEKALEGSAYDKTKQLINEKMAASKDGTIYLNDTDMKTIIEAAREEGAGKNDVKEQPQAGANLDLKI